MKRFILLVAIIAITVMHVVVYYRQGEAQTALEHKELHAGSSVTGVVGRDWKERYNIRSVDMFYISLVIESEVKILLDVYNGQQFITSSIDDSGEYRSRIEIAAQPNTVYLLEVSSYVRDVTEAAFRITAHLTSQSKVWEPAELTGEWHSRSITGSCHGQEHYIFTADGYYKKGDLYPKHDGTWSLLRDAATGKCHLTLQYKQFVDFESGWSPNEFTENSEYKTIDPNNIDLLIHGTGWVELTRCHNPGWNAQ